MGANILAAGWLCPAAGAPLPRGPSLKGDKMDRLCRLALLAADAALAQAGTPDWDRDRVSVILGSALGCQATDEEYYRGVLAGETPLLGASPRLFAYTLPSSLAGEISIHYGFQGPALTLVQGTTAGLAALGEGLRTVRRGSVAVVLAAEVASPWLSLLELVHDGAAAVLLVPPAAGGDRAGGELAAVATAFSAGQPGGALGQAVARVLRGRAGPVQVQAICAPEMEGMVRAAALQVPLRVDEALYPARAGAVGALLAVARLGETDVPSTLVLSCDRHGHAAAALWLRDQAGGGGSSSSSWP